MHPREAAGVLTGYRSGSVDEVESAQRSAVDLAYLAAVTPSIAVALQPILPHDIERVADFLHARLNSRLSTSDWSRAIGTPWSEMHQPNHGFMLVRDGEVVGANLAFYSSREVDGSVEQVCNLAALCVREDLRAHTVRLVRALLKQREYSFTDLSPSGNVVAMDERLGFLRLDTTTTARPNLPGRKPHDIAIISDHDQIERALSDRDLRIFQDHRQCEAARHVVIRSGDRHCYVMFRIDRRKRLRVFASLLYVGDPALYVQHGSHLGSFLLRRHRALVTLVERRLIGSQSFPGPQVALRGRPKLYKSERLTPTQVDYLYSELTCVPW